jgi:hypothetical protein
MTTGTLYAALVNIVAESANLTLDGTGLKVYDDASNLVIHVGEYETGKFGIVAANGAMYSSLFKTGSAGATANYVEISEYSNEGYISFIGDSGNDILLLSAHGDQGSISLYDAGTETGRLSVNNASTKELTLESKNSRGLSLVAASGEYIRLGPHQGVTAAGTIIDAGTGALSIDAGGDVTIVSGDEIYLTPGTTSDYVVIAGNLDVSGTITATTKDNIEYTESYGNVLLTVRESPEQKYIDEDIGILTDGVCRIDVDPIFLECIEPNTLQTRWNIKLTPYGKVNVYVDEIGDDYFVVKDFNGITTGIEFSWELSATRKNYAMIRFLEAVK